MSNVFFISDLHFGHASILDFRNDLHGRGWENVEDMNEWIIAGWNSQVTKRDVVWVLGDVAWGANNLHYLSQCNGMKRLVMGNHDLEKQFTAIPAYMREFRSLHGCIKKYGFVMTHVPIHPSELVYRWTHNVHGHIHHAERQMKDDRYINVNIDIIGNKPLPLEAIESRIMNGP